MLGFCTIMSAIFFPHPTFFKYRPKFMVCIIITLQVISHDTWCEIYQINKIWKIQGHRRNKQNQWNNYLALKHITSVDKHLKINPTGR